MATVLTIGVPVTRQDWWQALRAYARDHVGAAVELVVFTDPADALAGTVDAIVVDDTADHLTNTQVVALRDQGVRVLGVFHSGRVGRGRDWLAALGLAEGDLLAADVAPEELLDAVSRAVRSEGPGGLQRGMAVPVRPRGGPAGPWMSPVRSRSSRVPGRSVVPVRDTGAGAGTVVGVGGGGGAPGRTDVAVGAAHVLSSRGSTVLVDVDEHNPSVAVRLGFQVTPNVLDVSAAVRSGSRLEAYLATPARGAQDPVRFDAVCGLADPGDWGQLRDVQMVLDELARRWRWIVVDTGPSCSAEEVPPFGLRNAATRAALARADVVVAVCRGTRSGVLRLLEWAADALPLADRAGTGAGLRLVVNQAPREQFHRGQLRGQLLTHLPEGVLRSIDFLGRDAAAEDAEWDARSHALRGLTDVVGRFAPAPPSVPPLVVAKVQHVLERFGGQR